MANPISLKGCLRVPSDKSISHRALLLAAMADGTSHLSSLLDSSDVRSTIEAIKSLGASVLLTSCTEGLSATITGWGASGPHDPDTYIDCGNSGTTTRLLLGILSGYPVKATLRGDVSLSRRPMGRVIHPLSEMGAVFTCAECGREDTSEPLTLPLSIQGSDHLSAITHQLSVASAQVKTALLFAGLNADGTTAVVEPYASRDHTERMLPIFGAHINVDHQKNTVSLCGVQRLKACDIEVPGDPSSAIFWAVAAALIPGSKVELQQVSLNPTRIAAFEVMRRMGCDISYDQNTDISGEPIGTISVAYRDGLVATEIFPEEVPALIDEIPILALLATSAQGTTHFHKVGELRVKESDRLAAIWEGLSSLGCIAHIQDDDLLIEQGIPRYGVDLVSQGDHRLAMTWTLALYCFGLSGTVAELSCIEVSYPHFMTHLCMLRGA